MRSRAVLLVLLVVLVGCGRSEGTAHAESTPPDPTRTPAPPETPAAPGAFGFVSEDGVRMPVEDVFVVWNPVEGTLNVQLYPFELTAAERQEAGGGSSFGVAFHHDSPDPTRWADWCPVAEWQLTFPDGDPTEPPNHLYIMTYGFRKKSHTGNANLMGGPSGFPKLIQELEVRLADGKSSLRLQTRGEFEIFDSTNEWELTIPEAAIHVQEPPPVDAPK